MAVRGYVLIESEVGKAKMVRSSLADFTYQGTRVLNVDTVTGPFDVIMLLEADDLDTLGNAITEAIQQEAGVQRTTTCLSVTLH